MKLLGPMHPIAVRRHWPAFERSLQRILDTEPEHGLTMESIARDIGTNERQAWLLVPEEDDRDHEPAVILTGWKERQDGDLVIQVIMAGGDGVVDSVDLLWDTFTAYGRMHNAKHIEILGRKGWERACKHLGFRHLWSCYHARI